MNLSVWLSLLVVASGSSVLVTVINAIINRRKSSIDVTKTKAEVSDILTGATAVLIALYKEQAEEQEHRIERTEKRLSATEEELGRTRQQLEQTAAELQRSARVITELLPLIREIGNGRAEIITSRLEALISRNTV